MLGLECKKLCMGCDSPQSFKTNPSCLHGFCVSCACRLGAETFICVHCNVPIKIEFFVEILNQKKCGLCQSAASYKCPNGAGNYICNSCHSHCAKCRCFLCGELSNSLAGCEYHKTCLKCIERSKGFCFGCFCQICRNPVNLKLLECGHHMCATCMQHNICIICIRTCTYCAKTSDFSKSVCKTHYYCLECYQNFGKIFNRCLACTGETEYFKCISCKSLSISLTNSCNLKEHKYCPNCLQLQHNLCTICKECQMCHQVAPCEPGRCGHLLCANCFKTSENCEKCEKDLFALCGNCDCKALKTQIFECQKHFACESCFSKKLVCNTCGKYCDSCKNFKYSEIFSFNCNHKICLECKQKGINQCYSCKNCSCCGVIGMCSMNDRGESICENCNKSGCFHLFMQEFALDCGKCLKKIKIINKCLCGKGLKCPNCEWTNCKKCARECLLCNTTEKIIKIEGCDHFYCEPCSRNILGQCLICSNCQICFKSKGNFKTTCGHKTCLGCRSQQMCAKCKNTLEKCSICQKPGEVTTLQCGQHRACGDCSNKKRCPFCTNQCSNCSNFFYEPLAKLCQNSHVFCQTCCDLIRQKHHKVFCNICPSCENCQNTGVKLTTYQCTHRICSNCEGIQKKCPKCMAECLICKENKPIFSKCAHPICTNCSAKFKGICFFCDKNEAEFVCDKCGCYDNPLKLLNCSHKVCQKCVGEECKINSCHFCKKCEKDMGKGLCGNNFCEMCAKFSKIDPCPECSGLISSNCSFCGDLNRGWNLECGHFSCLSCEKRQFHICICVVCGANPGRNQTCQHQICDSCRDSRRFCNECAGNFKCQGCNEWINQAITEQFSGCPYCQGLAYCQKCGNWGKIPEVQLNGCSQCKNKIQCKSCNNFKAPNEVENNNYCLQCNNKLRCNKCSGIFPAELLLINDYLCPPCSGKTICQHCGKPYQEVADRKNRKICQNCENSCNCSNCGKNISIEIFSMSGGKCNICCGFTQCKNCSKIYENSFISNEVCQNCVEKCKKCGKPAEKGLKPPNFFCDSCNLHSCDVCFVGKGIEITKKDCGHFECEKCAIRNESQCARCLQKYACVQHRGYIYGLHENFFFTQNCCKIKICPMCRTKFKENHKCPQYVKVGK